MHNEPENANPNKKRSVSLEDFMPFIRECLQSSGSVTFFPKGTSMLPMLRQGIDKVTLSSVPEKLKKYDVVLYQRKNGAYVLHRIVKIGREYTCIGDNQFHFEKNVAPDSIVAVVTSFERGNKFYTADSFCYKIYCRFWHYTRGIRSFYHKLAGLINRP